LLTFSSRIHSRVKERTKQPPIAEQDPQKLVVIDVDRVKARRMEKVVAVDENGDTSPVSKLPGRTGGRLKLHGETSSTTSLAAFLEGWNESCLQSVYGNFRCRRPEMGPASRQSKRLKK
jgi:hypothetical protein